MGKSPNHLRLVKFQIFLRCLSHNNTLHPKSPLKICGIWLKFQIIRFFQICENSAQIPHIFQLMKRCRGVNHKHPSAESGIWNLAQTPQKNLKPHEAKPSEISNFLWCLKAKFQIPLSAEACLRLTPLSTQNYNSKSVEFEQNSHRFFKICENFFN